MSHRARAALLGQFRGAGQARRELLVSAIKDPVALRAGSALALLRSLGFDVPQAGNVLAAALPAVLAAPGLSEMRQRQLWEIYAATVDALPLGGSDERHLRRISESPFSTSAELLTRVASKRKRRGELKQAADAGERALVDLKQRNLPHPTLEAMTAYNLTWIYRQAWRVKRRQEILDAYRDRLAHTGFNWIGWIGLEEALMKLTTGDPAGAREVIESPRMSYVRRIQHPAYMIDDGLAKVLVDWCETGPTGIERRLRELVERFESHRALSRRAYSRINGLLLLAEHARVSGSEARMRRRLGLARRDCLSKLQQRQAALIEAVAYEGSDELRRLASEESFGLLAATAQRVLDPSRDQGAIAVTHRGPLPALF